MTESIREKAQATLADIEKLNAVVLPEPKGELVPLGKADAPTSAAITKRMAEINIADTQSIISFGSGAQAELHIESLDVLYEKTLAFYDELGIYIAAGEAKISELDLATIPAKEAEVQAAPEEQGVMKAQELRDMRAARDDLERRVHDLKLTRQVTMQSLPSIRLVQENDKSLVTKINSTLVNTVPLWETQLAQAVTIQRSAEAAVAVRDANDLTNELLKANAKNLRDANSMIRKEMERGVFDIAAVKEANANLIATIDESLQIADDGKRKRAEAEAELQKMEQELKQTLAAAKARSTGTGDTIGTATGTA